uniref:Uncharacterized protein n=1 Tax=Vitis vinifera TaxID=29760 RepID=F6HXZ2_VITVI
MPAMVNGRLAIAQEHFD